MNPSAIQALIAEGLPGASVEVIDLDGGGQHFQALVVSEQFVGLNKLKQHRLVNETVQAHINSGQLHALTLKTYTPEQWQAASVQVNLG
ncbi:BolA family protein [Leptolyngbya sp. FACHB-261]|uniref:BolA family protein n=1 Tax=Leptolyngbya sp. FACHB-261 TaxID=2692806 RepID=UPI0016830122|nr:BolA/IbaG family iron-sulfur metabolism protein [Leptolyngbya sp. FACHB-261]MBD2102169.1 BolA/IbaG family iron-sulfur metabolism protein [Leptolyngbya sp. FACHB-261]